MPERSLSEAESRAIWEAAIKIEERNAALEAEIARLRKVYEAAREVADLDCPYLGDCPENRLKHAVANYERGARDA